MSKDTEYERLDVAAKVDAFAAMRARAEKAEAALEEAIRIGVVVTQTKSDKTLMAERDAALARVKELEELVGLNDWADTHHALKARIAELEGALRPVVEWVDTQDMPFHPLLQRARVVLEKK